MLTITNQTMGENAHEYFGFHRVPGGWVYRDWAPGAKAVSLAGEFNDWNWDSHPLLSLGNGSWVVYLPGEQAFWEGCRVELRIDGLLWLPYDRRHSHG